MSIGPSQPLMITAACGQSRPPRDSAVRDTPADVAESVFDAHKAGACIAQVRAPTTVDPQTGRPVTELAVWSEIAERIRERCDILLHFGVAAMQIEQRIEMLDAARPDLASFLVGHHDIVTPRGSLASLRTREDGIRLARAHVELGVKPEFEIFHSGNLWNLNYILDEVPVAEPHYLTFFFGWSGGDWSPPTMEEFVHRLALLPEQSVYSVTVAGREQLAIGTLTIARGGNVRVGLGDYPYYTPETYGQSNAQFVTRMVQMAHESGRDVATVDEACELLGIRGR